MWAWSTERRSARHAPVVAWAVLLLGVLAGCGGRAATASSAPSFAADRAWDVARVVDGDTLRVAHAGVEWTVRLVGINAPERRECWADEATAALAALVSGESVVLERDVSDLDRYGRLLRYARTSSGLDLGGSLIDGGHAIARSYPPDIARDAEYRERQRGAQEAGRGLWAHEACGPSVTTGLAPGSIHIEVHPDAAGDDSTNLNDEWVRFTNTGAASLDLDGWMVRDESSSHRYRFVDLVLGVGAAVTLRSGCGTDSDTERFWCVSGSAIWNNGGDTVFLQDPAGNIVAQLSYPEPAIAPDAVASPTS